MLHLVFPQFLWVFPMYLLMSLPVCYFRSYVTSSVNLKNNFFSDKIKEIESTLKGKMKNLCNDIRLRKDLE